MNEELVLKCFQAARDYVSKNAAKELEWVRSITPESFDQMTCPEFLGEYCWVVYGSGFRVKTVDQKFDRLKAAYCGFDIDQICELRSVDAALKVIGNRLKAKGFVEGCRRIREEGFEQFKSRVKSEGIHGLQTLPFIKSVTSKLLAKNIGLADVAKDDVLLRRLAKEYRAPSVEEMVAFLAEKFGEKKGVVDLILWRFCTGGVWNKWRSSNLETRVTDPQVAEDQAITRARIDELLRFLPLFDVPGREFVERWEGGEMKDNVFTMPYPVYPRDVKDFFRLAGQPWWHDPHYVPAKAAEMLSDDALVSAANFDQIKAMLTYCVRGEKFCDGHWAEGLRSGRIAALLRRLQQLHGIVA